MRFQKDKKMLAPFFEKYRSLEQRQAWGNNKAKEQTYFAKTL